MHIYSALPGQLRVSWPDAGRLRNAVPMHSEQFKRRVGRVGGAPYLFNNTQVARPQAVLPHKQVHLRVGQDSART